MAEMELDEIKMPSSSLGVTLMEQIRNEKMRRSVDI